MCVGIFNCFRKTKEQPNPQPVKVSDRVTKVAVAAKKTFEAEKKLSIQVETETHTPSPVFSPLHEESSPPSVNLGASLAPPYQPLPLPAVAAMYHVAPSLSPPSPPLRPTTPQNGVRPTTPQNGAKRSQKKQAASAARVQRSNQVKEAFADLSNQLRVKVQQAMKVHHETFQGFVYNGSSEDMQKESVNTACSTLFKSIFVAIGEVQNKPFFSGTDRERLKHLAKTWGVLNKSTKYSLKLGEEIAAIKDLISNVLQVAPYNK